MFDIQIKYIYLKEICLFNVKLGLAKQKTEIEKNSRFLGTNVSFTPGKENWPFFMKHRNTND